eukprot:TRINITY_DN380_c0_g1_i1.p1 TRINITY_DN380_c0_g1~~TRINITY_DN380_c0_g1_i1.p1  ORF type:complete len:726 (-),score=196.88 TRINITY_DN380_c0_g1_i1:506-2683(-)
MTSEINFTPLYGVKSDGPLCYLLELDDYNILLDIGWNSNFDLDILEPLKDVIPKVDCILLSHADLSHVGALPYAVGHLGLRPDAEIFATQPVCKMGHMFLYDAFQARSKLENYDTFTLDDVDNAFEVRVKQLKYSQFYALLGKGSGITITPYAAGHMIGGAVWKITKNAEDTLYAVDYNHMKDRHLPSFASTNSVLTRPHLLITDAYPVERIEKLADRDTRLCQAVLAALRAGGTVLIPSDTAGRVLEILYVLNHHWEKNKLSYPIVLLSNVSYNVRSFAQSQLEWMNDNIQQKFDEIRNNPFTLRHVKVFHTMNELTSIRSAKVIVASDVNMAGGFSLELFTSLQDPEDLLVLTDRGEPGSVARQLRSKPDSISFPYKTFVEFTGEELIAAKAARQAEREQQQREKAERDAELARQQAADELIDVVDDEEEEPIQPVVRVSYPMYVYQEPQRHFDDYGEILLQTDFTPLVDDVVMTTAPLNVAVTSAPLLGSDAMDVDEDAADAPPAEEEEEQEERFGRCETGMMEDIPVMCKILVIDMEGRPDSNSIQATLANIAPRRLILVHGTEESTALVRQGFEKAQEKAQGKPTPVFTPSQLERVNVSFDANLFRAVVSNDLLKQLQYVQVTDYQLAWLDGVLRNGLLEGVQQVPGHNAAMIGAMRLGDLRVTLKNEGHTAEFCEGVLVVDSAVTIRKVAGDTQFLVEGPIGELYFKLRDLVYQQFEFV